MELEPFVSGALLLDIESTRGGRLNNFGAVLAGKVLTAGPQGLPALDRLGQKARCVLGHNLLGHDFPLLKAIRPDLALLAKPVIDTLYLSPLAFPQNPYHRLVKDYKLVRSSLNDPVADARLAASVFADQWHGFKALEAKRPGLLSFYRFCFQDASFNGFSAAGLALVFGALGARPPEGVDQALSFFRQSTSGLVCETAVETVVAPLLADPGKRVTLAYCLAWLQVAGGNSVLPPWVFHGFAEVFTTLSRLRDQPCGQDQCVYCQENHDPKRQLARFFGFSAFRPDPQMPDGQSMQQQVTTMGMGGESLLAILPTGAGKSLCYQLPALVRHRRLGTLTVVVSPLQALMKDQVDNLVQKTGTPFAEAIHGLLTQPERGQALERVRLGDTALLYLSPEQLRSRSVRNALAQRLIGSWVFDEAHCISKWGHDFRPDYLFAARSIRELAAEQTLPPVCGFTATAKPHVIEDIVTHLKAEIGVDLKVIVGGIERDNLVFEVKAVDQNQKLETTCDLVRQTLADDGQAAVVVYAATTKKAEEISDYLRHEGITAAHFHGKLDALAKREVLDAFVAGDIPVICATNAFGLGIDKDNIRLVLHHDMPGSLESYIQEAGRAGRDRQAARCVLLYDDKADPHTQFMLNVFSQIHKKEIDRILNALRRAKRNREGQIVITAEELLRDENMVGIYDPEDPYRGNKVKTAIAWLERAGFLQRNLNQTDLFQGKPLVADIGEAERIIGRLDLHPRAKDLWLSLLRLMINEDRQGMSADSLAESLFPDIETLRQMEKDTGQKPAQLVIQALHDMAEVRLIDQGLMLSAYLRPKGKSGALKRFDAVADVENRLLALIQETDPDADDGQWVELDLRRLTQHLRNQGVETTAFVIGALIKGLSLDGKGLAASHGSIELVHTGRNRYRARLMRRWQSLTATAGLRRDSAYVILRHLIGKAGRPGTGGEAAPESGGEVLVNFSTNELADAIRNDLALGGQIKKPLLAIDRALMFLHDHKIIVLQGGLAVFRQAMTIRLNPEAKKRRFTKAEYEPLRLYYRDKTLQVHVVMEYAKLARAKIASALRFVLDYFEMKPVDFIKRHFAGRQDIIERATTEEAYYRIVESLANPTQIGIVAAPEDQNHLILAGPGSGKTTAIVHRAAYLLEVQRVDAGRILILCFNHNAAVSLRKRLVQLAGDAARGVTVVTYHGIALRLAGICLRDAIDADRKDQMDFNGMIQNAVALLKGQTEIAGCPEDELRERLLAGYSHILVDEYQDIDHLQYELVSAIAGRTQEEADQQLSIMAVGDDDQNIYAFRGANVAFIRRFEDDYKARSHWLVENYRSSKAIIAAANQLIAKNRDRMKTDHPIAIDRHRAKEPSGERWQNLDPIAGGRVQILEAADPTHQAMAAVTELQRLKSLDPQLDWQDCAILTRTHETTDILRAALEEARLPVRICAPTGLPLFRLREIRCFIEKLETMEKQNCRASEVLADIPGAGNGNGNGNVWLDLVVGFVNHYREQTGDALLPVSHLLNDFFDHISEQRRDRFIGRGVFLGTVHGAKGMEFDHVIIADGGWQRPPGTIKMEEERRLLYVGMTRAKQTLSIFKTLDRPNPLLGSLAANGVLVRPASLAERIGQDGLNRHYESLSLEDIYLGYPSRFAPGHPIHRHLTDLGAGDIVHLAIENGTIAIQNSQGVGVARLSHKAGAKWRDRLETITEVRVLAMMVRRRQDEGEHPAGQILSERWELPLLEIVYRQR